MNWQDIYKLPLHNLSKIKAYSANSVMAYDYLNWKHPQEYYDHIVAIINGDIESDSMCQFINEGCLIFKVNPDGGKIPILRIRGWGHLTGTGGLHLPSEKAAEIQDSFVNYIVERLNSKTNV